jgi:hypothetical protein
MYVRAFLVCADACIYNFATTCLLIYYKDLAHIVTEVVKSDALLSASWRPKKYSNMSSPQEILGELE